MFANPRNIVLEPVTPLDVPEYQYQPEEFGGGDTGTDGMPIVPNEAEALEGLAALNFLENTRAA